MYEYHNASKELLDQIVTTNESTLSKAIDLIAETIIEDRIIHAFGTGHSHMIGLELFVRAGGLANVNAFLDSIVMTSEGARRSAEMERISGVSKVLWDQHKIEKEDLFIIIELVAIEVFLVNFSKSKYFSGLISGNLFCFDPDLNGR